MSSSTQHLRIRNESDATRSLIAASDFARQLGFSRQECQVISTAVSELTRNILKYAGQGEILLNEVADGNRRGIQITARDRGPGIDDVDEAMRDHFSSSGTLGLGLPGVRRMMDDFELDTDPGKGTRVIVRKWRSAPPKSARSLMLGAAQRATRGRGHGTVLETSPRSETPMSEEAVDCGSFVRPCRGERVSGDIAYHERRGHEVFLAIVDGLGHGRSAHLIAMQAARYFRSSWTPDLKATLVGLHECLRGTDGAAAGLCVVDVRGRTARYLGVGNTVIRSLGSNDRQAYSAPGTLGQQMRTPKEQKLAFGPGDLLLLYTDGVKEQFDIRSHTVARSGDARMIAREIVLRFGKDYDDASCLVLRYDT